ncbi:MAG: hypothetical protein JRG69_13160 [Deltaproteobacteria bacterium]|nr:hypothetical protein [Deltaproteobacteria bacterium]
MRNMTQNDAQSMIEDILKAEHIDPVEPVAEEPERDEVQEPISEIKTVESIEEEPLMDAPDELDEGQWQKFQADLQKHADAIYKLTDYNDHQGAMVYLALKVLKDKKLTAIAKALQTLHEAVGHMPPDLINFRDRTLKPMLDAATKKKFRPDEYDIIMGGF